MSDSDVVYLLKKKIFDDWRLRRFDWREVKYKYGFSKAWFYKFRARFIKDGDEGLRELLYQ
jgi:hypothetical protein